MKTVFFSFSMVCLLLFSFSVAATLDIVGGTTQLSFGSSSTQKQESFSQTLKIKNNFAAQENITLKNIRTTFTPKNDFRESQVQVTFTPDTLTAGQESTVKITVTTGDFDAVDADLKKRGAVEIGSLVIKADKMTSPDNNNLGEVSSSSASLKLEIANSLELNKIEIIKDEATNTISEDSTFTIVIDEDYDLRFTLKNLFDSSSNIELENINIEITSDDLDIDKSTSLSEILASKEGQKTTSISVDTADTGDVTVRVEGDDKWGGKHGEVFRFAFKVEDQDAEEDDEETLDDSDGDGIPDSADECLNTVSICDVDARGCPVDTDEDGTCDALDPTPNPTIRENQELQEEDGDDDLPLRTQSKEEDLDEEVTKKEQTKDKETNTLTGFIPFLIGFAVGILVTAGFSVLIRS